MLANAMIIAVTNLNDFCPYSFLGFADYRPIRGQNKPFLTLNKYNV